MNNKDMMREIEELGVNSNLLIIIERVCMYSREKNFTDVYDELIRLKKSLSSEETRSTISDVVGRHAFILFEDIVDKITLKSIGKTRKLGYTFQILVRVLRNSIEEEVYQSYVSDMKFKLIEEYISNKYENPTEFKKAEAEFLSYLKLDVFSSVLEHSTSWPTTIKLVIVGMIDEYNDDNAEGYRTGDPHKKDKDNTNKR